jgi:excisionase family DNA binding protein
LADRFLCVGRTKLEQGDRAVEAQAPPTGHHFDDRLVFTVTEVAELLGVSRAFAYELAARGELPVLRLGRRIVVPKAALLALGSMDVEH